jgi:hypothetical protein
MTTGSGWNRCSLLSGPDAAGDPASRTALS